MKYFILTNNPLAAEELGDSHDVIFADVSARELLIKARDFINEGAELLNHPMYGSVKPGETPYRSLLLTKKPGRTVDSVPVTDTRSVVLIGTALQALEKFVDKTENLSPQVDQDFRVVDMFLLRSAVQSADR